MFKSLLPRSESSLSHWQHEMNQLFDRFNKDFGLSQIGSMNSFDEYSPRIEINDLDDEYLIKAEVPGMTEKDITVSLRENNLILEGDRKFSRKKQDDEHYFSEFHYGSFYRNIPLRDDVNPDKVKASYKNGILTVELEKVEETHQRTKKIPVLNQ